MIRKKALIYGVTCQDGIYLAKYLIENKYTVHGICKHKKFKNIKNLNILKKIKVNIFPKFNKKKLANLLKKNFNEIYFLGEETSIKNTEIYNNEIAPMKVILDVIVLQKNKKSKFLYRASSKMYGNINYKKKFNLMDKKKPITPHGLSKFIGYEIIKSYRKMFNLPVCTAIFFKQEHEKIANRFHKILNLKKIEDYAILPGNKISLKKI
jgi:GDPmannose 4,6-dehydratase